MTHWFDRLSVRASDERGSLTRRTVVKSAAVGAVAVSPLASPVLERAAAEVGAHASAGPCECQRSADQVAVFNNNRLIRAYVAGGYLSGFTSLLIVAGLAGVLTGWVGSKFACGKCVTNPSGSLGSGGGGGTTCPPGTQPCDQGLCCFGNDLCCPCGGTAQCCVIEVGCTCC